MDVRNVHDLRSLQIPHEKAKGISILRESNPRPFALGTAAVMHIYALYCMLIHMRTTMDLSDELLRKAKRRAADEQIPLRDVVEAALRRYLSRKTTGGKHKLRWRVERGRLQPGVNLDDRDALFDLMSGRR